MNKSVWTTLVVVVVVGIATFVYFTWPSDYRASDMSSTEGTSVIGTIASAPGITPQAPQKGIRETAWAWQYTTTKNGVKTTPKNPSDYLLAFDATGKVVVTTECGTTLGSFTSDDVSELSLVSFTQGTTKSCPKSTPATAYIKSLTIITSYRATNTTLTLSLTDGSVMVFERQYAEK